MGVLADWQNRNAGTPAFTSTMGAQNPNTPAFADTISGNPGARGASSIRVKHGSDMSGSGGSGEGPVTTSPIGDQVYGSTNAEAAAAQAAQNQNQNWGDPWGQGGWGQPPPPPPPPEPPPPPDPRISDVNGRINAEMNKIFEYRRRLAGEPDDPWLLEQIARAEITIEQLQYELYIISGQNAP
jgi:hypothetical protein